MANNLELTSIEFSYLKELLIKDAEDIAKDVSFFEDLDINPKDYVDERIGLCKKFGFDFWECVELWCSDYQYKRLQALYEGKSLNEFIESYEQPTQKEIAKQMLRTIFRKPKDI